MLIKITPKRALFHQVLIAPTQEVAFDRYCLLVRTFGPLRAETLSGGQRSKTDWRSNMELTAQDRAGDHLFVAMMMAQDADIMSKLADLFSETDPKSPYDILCVVEDAICIITHFGE